MTSHVTQTIGRVVRAHLAEAQRASELLAPDNDFLKLCARVSVAQAIEDLRSEKRRGAALEASRELEMRFGPIESANGIRIPWETLTRADVVGTSAQGGYLVESVNAPFAAPSILPMGVFGRAGVTTLRSRGNLSLPKVNTAATATWLSTEATPIAESDLAFGQVSFSPHQLGGYVEMSRLLTIQSSPDSVDLSARELSRRMGVAFESALISGAGIAGAPHGVINAAGVNTSSGTSLALSGILSAEVATGDALTPESAPAWIAARTVAQTLRQRAEIYGAVNGYTPIWAGAIEAGAVAGHRAFSTSNVPSGVAIFGNFAYAIIVDFSGGVELSLNPYANFQSGVIGLRAIASVDCGIVWPSAFSVVSSIT